jgi:hypothetical protein
VRGAPLDSPRTTGVCVFERGVLRELDTFEVKEGQVGHLGTAKFELR